MKRKKIKVIALVSAAAIALTLLAACSEKEAPEDTPRPSAPVKAGDYSEVFSAIKEARKNNKYARGGGAVFAVDDSMILEEAGMNDAEPAPSSESDAEYSGTNVQVDGVDEADVVKTDGEYIYVLRENKIHILKADGENTKLVSSIEVGGEESYPNELYVSGDRLSILSTDSMHEGITPYRGYWSGYSGIRLYDISDRENAKLLTEAGQDGYYNTSRMLNGVLYVISAYSIYDYSDINGGKPETFVPALYREGEAELLTPDCIIVMPEIDSVSYTVITSYSMEDGSVISAQSELGRTGTIYMNKNNLFIAGGKYDDGAGEAYKDGSYTVTEYFCKNTTEISRYAIDGGSISFAASGVVDGELLNQFSMDEYNGSLRVVTTVYNSHYKVYEDKAKGWSNYEWLDDVNANALYILDDSLSITGSVEDLAKDERVYSVRFDGDYGYFVTFRQVDPLFTVDLRDPASPKVLSALKIPGFSEYLHVYGDGRLFGLGMNADEETGRTEGMKLSMFDTTDPTNVTEKHKLSLDSDHSEARYNHKAILIAPAKDIIAFPANTGYEVYGYSDEDGFYKKASIELDESGDNWGYGYGMRGLFIGDYAYVVSGKAVNVLDMQSLRGIIKVSFS